MRPARLSGHVAVRRTSRIPATLLTALGWVIGVAVTVLILGTPYLVFGVHNPSLHLVLDTVDGCVALLVAFLLYGRYLRSHRMQDLLLAQGMFLLALAGLGLSLLLEVLDAPLPGTFDVWLPQTLRVAGALLVVCSAVVGRGTADVGRHRWISRTPWLVIAAVVLVLWLARGQLPVALAQTPPSTAQLPVITGHPLLLVAQSLTALGFAVASVAFTAQARQRQDELLRWLGPAFALGAFARLNYVLFPSLYTDWIYTGDVLRTGGYLLLLVGAAREISDYWSAQARAAVLEDRRRLARELHDGVVQELAFIRAEAHTAAPAVGSPGRIIASCDRALDEARAAIDALGQGSEEPLGFVLHRAARQVAERYDGHLEVEVDDSVTADADQTHELVRIAREAVSNALRHGKASRVTVSLASDAMGRRLVVQDDGCGFDVAAAQAGSTGYGLTSMRDRARALPGSFTLDSTPGRGTVVEVAW